MKESEVIGLIKKGGVFDLSFAHFEGRRMTVAEVVAIFNAFEAFWHYQGEACVERPHALLKSGKHSNGFIMCMAVLDYPWLCMLLANEMLKAVEEEVAAEEICKIDFVASSAYSAISVGFCLAYFLSIKYNRKVKHITAEKDAHGNPTKIRGGLDPSLTGLVINELMTTADGSTWETKEAVLKCNGDKPAPKVLPLSFVLMHRSKDFQLKDGSKVVPVFHFEMADFAVPEGEECPYCEAGSKAIKPKVDDNWDIIHGRANP